MRRLTFLVAAACTFGLTPLASRLGPVAGPCVSVLFAVLLACAASGAPLALAVAAGAIGAFGAGVVSATSSACAGAFLVACVFAERTTRVRTPVARVAHIGIALVGGALAGSLSLAYARAPFSVQAVSIVVSSVLVSLPLLVEADDPVAHALERAATLLREPAARALLEGAALRRHVDDSLVDAPTRRGVARTWRALLKLAEARTRLERVRSVGSRTDAKEGSAADAVAQMLDQKMVAHVGALTRAYTAVDAAKAAEIGLDDAAARGVDAVGERLEDVSRAIVEVKG